MYSNSKIKISSGTAKTTFLSTSGVKQGDNVAALLFLFVMMAASELMDARWNKLNLAKPELYISDKKCINHRDTASSRIKHVSYYKSLYADDEGLIFQTFEDLVKGTEMIVLQFRRVGLDVHLGVTDANGNKKESKTEDGTL